MGAPACHKLVVAAAATLEKSHHLTLGYPATVHVPQEVEILLKQYPTPALSQQILLTADTLKKMQHLESSGPNAPT